MSKGIINAMVDASDMDNGKFAASYLKNSNPSDEIVLTPESYEAIRELRSNIVGDNVDLVADVIWSKTIPLKDFIVTVSGPYKIRFCIFEDAVNALDDVPVGKTALVGAVQELGHNAFWLFGVVKGENRAEISTEHYSENGDVIGTSRADEVETNVKDIWRFWHGVQLALLHPQTKDVFATPKIVKERKRVKDMSGKRKRETWYMRRHVIDPENIEHSVREINRHCQAWYVIGHWRHFKDGSATYINGYWKGELRHLKRNIDKGRNRKVVV